MTYNRGHATATGNRDFQRERVYRTERLLHSMLDRALDSSQLQICGSTVTLEPEAKFGSPEDVQAFVNRVLQHPGVVDDYGVTVVRVRPRKGIKSAHYAPASQELAIPNAQWALRESIVLHELAHHFDKSGGPDHGPEFVKVLVNLVSTIMGPQAAFVLRILFNEGGVQ